MLGRTFYCCVILAAFFPLPASQTADHAASAAPYAVVSQLSLSESENQVDGKLQVMEDVRLTPQLRKSLWQAGDIDFDENPAVSAFKRNPLRNAQLRILASDGTAAEVFPLERPLAKLGTTKLYGDSRLTYLVTVDYSAGFGSYSGPITMPVEVRDSHLVWLEATDRATGKKTKIEMMQSLKTTWKIVGSPSGGSREFLEAACRPNFKRPAFTSKSDLATTDDDFILIYTRYYFDGIHWIHTRRQHPGFSEFEGAFPSRKLFR